jgi:ATP-dependent Clp protease ATP-binding subunit ClpC
MGTKMVLTGINYNSPRSHKARFNVQLSKNIVSVLGVSAFILMIAGAVLVFIGWPIGWTLIGLTVVPAMIIEWKHGELKELLPTSEVNSIDDILDGDVLGRLSRSPTPYEIATIVGQVYGGHFFAARFGIGSGFLQEISSKEKIDTSNVWKVALSIQDKTKTKTLSAGVVLAALIQVYPKHDSLLAHLQLSTDDILNGIMWQNHIDYIIEEYKKPRLTGGIGRDWSFGWIPNLSSFGQNISEYTSPLRLESHNDALDKLLDMLSGTGDRNNAVIVGPNGTGKTEIVHAFAARLMDAKADVPSNIKFHQVFLLDASSLISAAPGRGELEGLINDLMNEAYRAKNIIICLDNAQLFFEEGVGSVDLSNLLVPILEAGSMPIILTMDDQRYLQISQNNSLITSTLNRISVSQTSRDETIAIMQDKLAHFEFHHNVTYMYQSLTEAYRLGERYVHDLAMPGRAIKLLESAAEYADDGLVTAKSVQEAIEQTVGIKVSVASTDDDREKLLNLEDLIHKRMINQKRAVSVVSDALRRARAGVRNQNRPIGTFLFLGPTGVGKTELAKALASVYFDGEDKIIRLDMNEYVNSSDVDRLISDGAQDSSSLTAQVMKKPFSVILLDEIEKAHPNVLTLFLQMLDEGILRDSKNREVSFRDAIVIATSNAGADSIREHIERGMDIEQFEGPFIDELISSNQFKPEFLNRFDEIVMFRPLSKEELVQVIDLILVDVNKTLELQKVSVVVAQDAKEYLVEFGYDPRLGARPMRRVVQKAVENTIAKQMLSGAVEAGGVVEITLEQVQAILGSKFKADEIAGLAKGE